VKGVRPGTAGLPSAGADRPALGGPERPAGSADSEESPQIREPAAVSKGGIVAAHSRKAVEVGAKVLAADGDCVDAIIATTFALGILKPRTSSGGGAMVFYRARDDRGMRAPVEARPKQSLAR
jgi:gamma-glutamyltranspeptidase